MASSSKSSSFLMQREELSSYRIDGVAGEVSAGCHDFVVWRGIMVDCLKFWPDCAI
jgi:hypothetical protein